MNEQLIDIAMKANDQTGNEIDLNHKPLDAFLAKFAELIVRESLVDFYRNHLDTTCDEDITVQVDRYVKQHFGVE